MPKYSGTCFVYVIGVSTRPVKIGRADNPTKRLGQLQVGCPDELSLHHAARGPWQIADRIEKATHEEFAEHHRRGEWFNVTAERAIEAVERHKDRFLREAQGVADSTGDVLFRLSTRWPLCDGARHILERYWAASDTYRSHANGYVRSRVSEMAFTMFALAVGEKRRFTPVMTGDTQGAALVKAINTLAEFDEKYHDLRSRRDASNIAQKLNLSGLTTADFVLGTLRN